MTSSWPRETVPHFRMRVALMVRGHLHCKGRVDEALPRDGILAFEEARHDDGAKVAASGCRACMPGVEVALIDHFDMNGREPFADGFLDARAAIIRCGGHRGVSPLEDRGYVQR